MSAIRSAAGRVCLSVTGLAPFVPVGTNGRFKKEVLRVGRWLHPGTGERLDFDRAFLERLARDTNRWIAIGNKVHFPAGPDCHDEDARDALRNLGFWSNFRVEGARLLADVEVLAPGVAALVGTTIQDVSPEIRWPARAATGEVLEAAVFHVAATPVPAIPGQSNFERLSRLAREVLVAKKRKAAAPTRAAENATPGVTLLAWARTALGLDADVTEESVVDALTQRLSAPPAEAETAGTRSLARLAREVREARAEAAAATKLATQVCERSAAEKEQRDEEAVELARHAAGASGLPIPEETCKLARELFQKGEDAAARQLLSAYTARAADRRVGLARPVVEPSLSTGDRSARLAQDEAERFHLDAAGWDVERDEQGFNKRDPDGRVKKTRRRAAGK